MFQISNKDLIRKFFNNLERAIRKKYTTLAPTRTSIAYRWVPSPLYHLEYISNYLKFGSRLILFAIKSADNRHANIKNFFHRFLGYYWQMFLTTELYYTYIIYEIEQSRATVRTTTMAYKKEVTPPLPRRDGYKNIFEFHCSYCIGPEILVLIYQIHLVSEFRVRSFNLVNCGELR